MLTIRAATALSPICILVYHITGSVPLRAQNDRMIMKDLLTATPERQGRDVMISCAEFVSTFDERRKFQLYVEFECKFRRSLAAKQINLRFADGVAGDLFIRNSCAENIFRFFGL